MRNRYLVLGNRLIGQEIYLENLGIEIQSIKVTVRRGIQSYLSSSLQEEAT
ncbi:MAG: hypothetical protein AABY10_01230 [Nanoarchaeota archaeon]